jgi:membrane-associated protease RseP (regulator of RpoE activity)
VTKQETPPPPPSGGPGAGGPDPGTVIGWTGAPAPASSRLNAPEPAGPEAEALGDHPGAERITTGQWVRLAVLVGLLVLLTATAGIWGLVIVLGLVFMIFMHELGHYIAARRAGMKVTEFFLGFGPRIWSVHRNGIDYGVKAIPAGAYVKIIGMHNLEEVAPEDEAVTYRQAPFWQRFSVAVAGSAMHFAMALVLMMVLLSGFGLPGGQLNPDKRDSARWEVGGVEKGSAADKAGLEEGDRILTIDGQKVGLFDHMRGLIKNRGGDRVALVVQRGNRQISTSAVLGTRNPKHEVTGYLGVGPTFPTERVNPVAAVPKALDGFVFLGWQSIQGLGRVFSPSGLTSYGKTVANAQQDRKEQATERAKEAADPRLQPSASASSQDDGVRLMSLLGVFQVGVQAGDSDGLASVLTFFVLINIFVGIFNLVPLLPFDGGHIAIAVYEKLQELRQHLRTRYFADVARLLPLTYLVVLVLIGIFVTSVYLDIANPVKIN